MKVQDNQCNCTASFVIENKEYPTFLHRVLRSPVRTYSGMDLKSCEEVEKMLEQLKKEKGGSHRIAVMNIYKGNKSYYSDLTEKFEDDMTNRERLNAAPKFGVDIRISDALNVIKKAQQ